MAKKRPNSLRPWLIGLSIVFGLALVAGYFVYRFTLAGNLNIAKSDKKHLYIRTGWNFQDVYDEIVARKILKDTTGFYWLATKMNYPANVRPGRYPLEKGMGNVDLVRMLRSGEQEPVKLTLKKMRTQASFAELVGIKIEPGPEGLLAAMEDKEFLDSLGMTTHTLMAHVRPNTYEVNWNTSAKQLIIRLKKESDKFWTQARLTRAKSLNLSREDVVALASIVDDETLKEDEKPVVAGVYLNRLKKDMLLEADPTVVFAADAFGARRVTKAMLKTVSPYNTYMYKGLPPGPINTPANSSIDAVLNSADHDFLYFCARPDRSGYHDFARTFPEHLANARAYHRALNERGILK